MKGRVLSLMLAAFLGSVSVSSAQEYRIEVERPGVEAHRVMIAPVLGIRGPLLGSRTLAAVAVGDLLASRFEWGSARSSGPATGVEVDLRLVGSVGLSAMGLYLGADDVALLTEVNDRVVSEMLLGGPEVWVAAAGLSVRLLDEFPFAPAGYLVVGPALIRQDYSGSVFDVTGLERRVDSPGMWLGYRALFPIGMSDTALSVVLEDVVPFWSRDGEFDRLQQAADLTEASTSIGLRGATHLPMLRIGVAFRM